MQREMEEELGKFRFFLRCFNDAVDVVTAKQQGDIGMR